MAHQKHLIVAIILLGLFLTLPLASAKLTFPINFRNIFSVSSDKVSTSLLSNHRLTINNSIGQIAFWDENDNLTGDNALFWNNDAKMLGIGTNNPQVKLEIVGINESYLRFREVNTDHTYSTNFGFLKDSLGVLDTYIKNTCGRGAGCDLILDFPYGNVGIGTTSPSHRLDVAGKAYASEGFKLPVVDNGDVEVCNADIEGLVLIKKQNGANLSYRKVIICMQTGEGVYSWETLLSSSWGSYATKEVKSS